MVLACGRMMTGGTGGRPAASSAEIEELRREIRELREEVRRLATRVKAPTEIGRTEGLGEGPRCRLTHFKQGRLIVSVRLTGRLRPWRSKAQLE